MFLPLTKEVMRPSHPNRVKQGSSSASLRSRREEKVLSRKLDKEDLRKGVSRAVIQRRNSIFSANAAKQPMLNLLESLGQ